MSEILIVENGRKRKTRRKMSAKQKKYFGKSRKPAKRKAAKRRRNPSLATYTASNPRRGRRPARHRNPSGFGFASMFDFGSIVSVASGILTAKYSNKLVSFVWPAVPVTGMMATAVKVATVLAVGFGSKFVGVSARNRNTFIAGGVGYCLFEIANEYVAPLIGLNGYTVDQSTISYDVDVEPVASQLSGYAANNQYLDPVIAA